MFTRIRSTITDLFRRDRFEREMADEMRFHMRAYADDLKRSGVPAEEAERRARLEFGSVDSAAEDCRQARGLQLFDELRQDLRYAARQLAKAPGFSAAVIVSLALGIGANTAIFSLMDAVLLRTLPIADSERLYFLEHRSATDTSSSSNYPLLDRYRGAKVFSGVTSFEWTGFTVVTPDGKEHVEGQFASGNYHAVLGVPISLGRGFSSEPDRPSGQPPIAVISDAYWQRRFAGAADVIGKTLSIDGRAVTIVGVTAPGFYGLQSGRRFDITLPMSVKALDEPEFLDARDGWTSLTIVGRLATGVTETAALTTADAIFREFWMEPENAWAREGDRGAPRSATLVAAGRGSRDLRQRYTRPLRILMTMVGILLLIACANVANLLLARAAARAKEVAIRLSIGAGRARIVRQLLTESILLAGLGGVLGLAVAMASSGAILSLFASGPSPIRLEVELNRSVLAFTIAVSIATGIGFGLVPAFRATRVDVTRALKESGIGAARRGGLGMARTLVIAQISLCALVIAAASLIVQSLHNLRTFDAGFERANILLFNVSTADPAFTPERRASFLADLQHRLRGLPGALDVSLSTRSPIDFSAETRGIFVPGFQEKGRHGVSAYVVTPEFLTVFGIRLLQGRGFGKQDGFGAARVALVNEAMARFYFGTSNPLGRTFRFGTEKDFATIVGVVEDTRHEQLREAAPATVYTSMDQPATRLDGKPAFRDRVTAAIRTRTAPSVLAAAVRGEVRALNPEATVSYVRTMQEQVDATLVRERLLATLSTGFGFLALVLAFVGLYGVMSYRITRRTREIGIRMSLGATQYRVLRGVLRETLVVATTGIVIGLALAFGTTSVVSVFLFGLSPRDPAMFTLVALVLLGTALVAGYLPARRAAAVEPMRALRTE